MEEWKGIEAEAEAHILERQACGGCDCVNLEDLLRRAVAHGRAKALRTDPVWWGVLADLASRQCEQPGQCTETLPPCLPCRARWTVDAIERGEVEA